MTTKIKNGSKLNGLPLWIANKLKSKMLENWSLVVTYYNPLFVLLRYPGLTFTSSSLTWAYHRTWINGSIQVTLANCQSLAWEFGYVWIIKIILLPLWLTTQSPHNFPSLTTHSISLPLSPKPLTLSSSRLFLSISTFEVLDQVNGGIDISIDLHLFDFLEIPQPVFPVFPYLINRFFIVVTSSWLCLPNFES